MTIIRTSRRFAQELPHQSKTRCGTNPVVKFYYFITFRFWRNGCKISTTGLDSLLYNYIILNYDIISFVEVMLKTNNLKI